MNQIYQDNCEDFESQLALEICQTDIIMANNWRTSNVGLIQDILPVLHKLQWK